MRTLMKGVLIGACVLAVSGATAAASARRGMPRDPDVRKARFEKLVEFLDLSDKQVEQLKKLREGNLSQMADLRREMMRVRNEIRGEMLEDSPDVSALKKLTAKKGEIRTQIEMARLEQRLAMRDILTPEQRDKMLMHRGRGMRDGFRGAPGFGRGPGRRYGCGMGRRIGRNGVGPGLDGGGAGFGMGPGALEMECLGLGPGPFLWCEE